MKGIGIRMRIMLLCAALVTAVTLLAMLANLQGQQSLLRRYYAKTLDAALTLAEDDVHYEKGRLVVDRKLDNPGSVRLSAYDSKGALLYGRVLTDGDFEDGFVRIAKGRDGTDWYVCDRFISPTDGQGLWLRACISASAEDSIRGGEWHILVILLPLQALAAALIGAFVARRLTSPLAAMTATAAAIADGSDLKKRIPLEGPHDELYHMGSVYNDMLARLEQSFERECRFSADASHELRTPVAAMLNQSEFALSEEATEDDRREALRTVHSRAKDMRALIGTLLLLSRMESGQYELTKEEVCLDELCIAATDNFLETAALNEIEIKVETNPVMVKGDALLLAQAVVNLLDNAVKFNKPGGSVELTLEAEENNACIRVRDEGYGMSEEQLAHAFERFYQADASHRHPGAGLGLSLVERIARLHGGSITASSVPGAGSVFTLELPMNRKEDIL